MTTEDGGAVRPAIPTVTTTEALAEVVEAYLSADEFVFDVETVGDYRLDPRRNRVMWLGLAKAGRADIIPLGHPNGELVEVKRGLLSSGVARLAEGKTLRKHDVSQADSRRREVFSPPPPQLSPGEVFEALRPIMFGPAVKIGHNVKFDLESVAKYYDGEVPAAPYGDTMIGDFLLDDTNQNQMSLAALCKRHFSYVMPKGVGAQVEIHGFQKVARYLHGDVRFTWLLWQLIKERLEATGLSSIMRLEMDVLEHAVLPMEMNGVLVDIDAMEVLRAELDKAMVDTRAAAFAAAGQTFNLNSVQDKARLLFTPEGRNLTPKVVTAKTGAPSTSEEALKHHAKDPLVQALMEYADLNKLMGSFVVPYVGGEVTHTSNGKTKTEIKESLLVDGRVHAQFRQHGTRTGRLSCAQPNLQQIPNPQKSELGKRIRSMFIAGEGRTFLAADYGQIEPRIIASLSKDPTMVAAFNNGEDIYTAISDPLGTDRAAGKLIVLSMSYGVGVSTLAERLNISVTQAKQLLNDFYAKFASVEKYKAQVINEAARRRPRPFVTTLLGRRRFIPNLASRDRELISSGKRQAFNAKIQGSAADLMKVAMVRVAKALPPEVDLLLTVHDELGMSVPDDMVEETKEIVTTAMTGIKHPKIIVPLTVDIGTGANWAECK